MALGVIAFACCVMPCKAALKGDDVAVTAVSVVVQNAPMVGDCFTHVGISVADFILGLELSPQPLGKSDVHSVVAANGDCDAAFSVFVGRVIGVDDLAPASVPVTAAVVAVMAILGLHVPIDGMFDVFACPPFGGEPDANGHQVITQLSGVPVERIAIREPEIVNIEAVRLRHSTVIKGTFHFYSPC